MISQTAAHPDRSVWMTVLGVLEILGGLFLVLVKVVSLRLVPGWNFGTGVVFVFASGAFMAMGYGSIRGRRWARTLLVISSVAWLAGGVFGMLTLAMGGRNFLPPGTALPGPVLALVLVICLVIYLAMPLALLLFYRSDGVRLTFEARDPSVPWTDRVPPAVLFLVLAEALMSVTLLSGVPTLHGMPLFGQILEGPAAKAWALGTGLLCGWSSVGLYKLDIRAWYAAMALMALGGVGALLNHVLLDQEAMLRAVGMTAEQIAQMAAARPSKADMIFSTVTSFGGFVALLAYVRRYFTRV